MDQSGVEAGTQEKVPMESSWTGPSEQAQVGGVDRQKKACRPKSSWLGLWGPSRQLEWLPGMASSDSVGGEFPSQRRNAVVGRQQPQGLPAWSDQGEGAIYPVLLLCIARQTDLAGSGQSTEGPTDPWPQV